MAAMRGTVYILLLLAAILPIRQAFAEADLLQQNLAKADQLYLERRYEDATRILKEIVATPEGKTSYAGWAKLARAYRSIGAYEMCVEAAQTAIVVARDNAQRAEGHWVAGMCHAEQQSESGNYAAAERELRIALQLAPENYSILVSLGSVLMKEHRDAEGQEEMKAYLRKYPDGSLADTARALVQLPALARVRFMPDFKIQPFAGAAISSAELSGKIVLVDFWAPWCAPCRAAIPHLRSLSAQYSEKQLAVISVCGDEKEETWRNYIQENAMDWPQYYDRYATMRRLFDVKNYPTYFIIDGNGIIRTKVIGTGAEQIEAVEREVKKEIERLGGERPVRPKP